MLEAGNPMFLLIPSPSNERVLHPGTVIESDRSSFVAKFEETIAPAIGADLNAFCEVRGQLFQQGATVIEFRDQGDRPLIAFKRSGEPISAENRQTFRVSISAANITARVDRERSCPVVDISPEGFAVIAAKKYTLGSLVQCSFTYEETTVTATARVQAMQVKKDGKLRYGLLVPRSNAAARKSLQQISAAAQRMQLRRRRGAAA
jgi:PilZ domain